MRFAAASLIVFVVIGAGLSMLISRQFVDRERKKRTQSSSPTPSSATS